MCIGWDQPAWVAVDASGKTRKIPVDEVDTDPLSPYCPKPILFSEFWPIGTRSETFLGALDLTTGKVKQLVAPRSNAELRDEPPFYSHGPFFNTHLDRVIARTEYYVGSSRKPEPLWLINCETNAIQITTVPEGAVASWAWTDERGGQLYVLTVRPGTLRPLGLDSLSRRIPALDKARSAMISPTQGRAIGFTDSWPNSTFLVDLAKPDMSVPVKIEPDLLFEATEFGWMLWSPDGKRIAAIHSAFLNKPMELYVGDPAKPLQRFAAPKGWRFPAFGCGRECPMHTLGWNDKGDELYTLVVEDNPAVKWDKRRWAVVKAGIPQ